MVQAKSCPWNKLASTPSNKRQSIRLRGVRQNNLKGFDLDLLYINDFFSGLPKSLGDAMFTKKTQPGQRMAAGTSASTSRWRPTSPAARTGKSAQQLDSPILPIPDVVNESEQEMDESGETAKKVAILLLLVLGGFFVIGAILFYIATNV